MSLNIKWVHKSSGTFTDIPPTFFEQNYQQVVRVDELRRWLEQERTIGPVSSVVWRNGRESLRRELLAELEAAGVRGA